MTINDQIRDEKLQYNMKSESAKTSALSSGKIDRYEYLTGEEILPSNQQKIIEQAKFTYSPLGKAFEKQIKTIEDQGQKQVEALNTFKSDNEKLTIEDVIPKSALNNDEAIKELDKIKEIEETIDREKLVYRASEYTYSFKNFQIIRTFGRDIYEGKITLEEVNIDKDNLLRDNRKFNNKTRPQNNKKMQEKRLFLKTCINFLRVEKKFLTALIAECFQQILKVQVF